LAGGPGKPPQNAGHGALGYGDAERIRHPRSDRKRSVNFGLSQQRGRITPIWPKCPLPLGNRLHLPEPYPAVYNGT
jgi:hypothetical protein